MIIDYDTAMQVKARAATQGMRVMVCITDEIHHRVDYLIPSSDGDGIYIVSEHSANDTYRIGHVAYCRPYIQAKKLTKDVLARVQAEAEKITGWYHSAKLREQEEKAAHERKVAALFAALAGLPTRVKVEMHTDYNAFARLYDGAIYGEVDSYQDGVTVELRHLTSEQAQAVLHALTA